MIQFTPLAAILTVSLAAAGCEAPTNPPTEPAAQIDAQAAAAPEVPPPPEVAPPRPGDGPLSIIGRWAADSSWCSSQTGDQRPIEITTTRFEGYENSCSIDQIEERQGGYDLALTCQAEGATSRERLRLAAQENALRMTWPDREGVVVLLTRCGEGQPPG